MVWRTCWKRHHRFGVDGKCFGGVVRFRGGFVRRLSSILILLVRKVGGGVRCHCGWGLVLGREVWSSFGTFEVFGKTCFPPGGFFISSKLGPK